MSQYDNSLRGALFVNDRKEKDTHPDYRGSLEDDTGREFWVSAWIKTSGKGAKYLSLALTPKNDDAPQQRSPQAKQSDAAGFLANNQDKIAKHRPAPSSAAPKPAPDFDSFDDDIPF